MMLADLHSWYTGTPGQGPGCAASPTRRNSRNKLAKNHPLKPKLAGLLLPLGAEGALHLPTCACCRPRLHDHAPCVLQSSRGASRRRGRPVAQVALAMRKDCLTSIPGKPPSRLRSTVREKNMVVRLRKSVSRTPFGRAKMRCLPSLTLSSGPPRLPSGARCAETSGLLQDDTTLL